MYVYLYPLPIRLTLNSMWKLQRYTKSRETRVTYILLLWLWRWRWWILWWCSCLLLRRWALITLMSSRISSLNLKLQDMLVLVHPISDPQVVQLRGLPLSVEVLHQRFLLRVRSVQTSSSRKHQVAAEDYSHGRLDDRQARLPHRRELLQLQHPVAYLVFSAPLKQVWLEVSTRRYHLRSL